MQNWEQLLSLNKLGDTKKRLRKEDNPSRSAFEVDYDRVVFSTAFRRLQDKTQVIPLSKTDFVHTRLTHSLETSVVGRSLGREIGYHILEKNPQLQHQHHYKIDDFGAIIAAACLAHDIGNPPFGHSGEKAIGEYLQHGNGIRFKNQLPAEIYQDLIDFEGNANGFKLLVDQNALGMPLRTTFATLGAFLKYPKPSLPKKPSPHVADKKFSFFTQQKNQFDELVAHLELIPLNKEQSRFCRHPLAYLVEAADDICYTIIDLEDATNLGWIDEDKSIELLNPFIKDKFDWKIYNDLSRKNERLSYLRALSINGLINEAKHQFINNEENIISGKMSKPLLKASSLSPAIDEIIDFSVKHIYQSREVTQKEIAGYQILNELLDFFTNAIERINKGKATNLDQLVARSFLKDLNYENEDTADWLINCCSFVASLTDGEAVRIHRKLKGNHIER